eukprot:scaffold5037_cov114-Isochrysis_galbana.AAC.2
MRPGSGRMDLLDRPLAATAGKGASAEMHGNRFASTQQQGSVYRVFMGAALASRVPEGMGRLGIRLGTRAACTTAGRTHPHDSSTVGALHKQALGDSDARCVGYGCGCGKWQGGRWRWQVWVGAGAGAAEPA